MREILFKAKRLDNGEWVEGWYCEYPFRRWPLKPTIIPAQLAIDGTFEFVDVDPSTVCQYTGLTDKNGKKIFEGDKLRCYVPIYKLGQKAPVGERWLAGTVIWDESSREEPGYWALDADDENGNPATYTFSSKFEVIGSIHDGEGGH
jgi:uncharacterized phage protein (TIGR01671 family)